MKKRLSKGLKKHVRQEKNRIRRKVLDLAEQNKLIKELYEKIGFDVQNTRSSSRSKDKSMGEKSK